ncbi:MAG TPA: aromatic ring-hydroxylating dioxygenase subunit alpha [Candidatus Saccharimonadales bacterium]|nr:aromatic ring-hydroxylating dioxygenase subunit alpha [Candidatus Saccharimonadales bacterium]
MILKSNSKAKVRLADIPYVGRGTPGGEWFRRYWLVVGTVPELQDIPQAVKVLGEELVLFRDVSGTIGLIGAHCPHRGASLEYGDIECDGIRCPYHGWLFDVGGQCLEMPAEPKDSKFPEKVKHLFYPVREQGGLLFAYLGRDQDRPPPLPRYKPLADSAGQRSLEATRVYDYNWFNFIENGADPAHFSILHRADPNDGTWRSWFFDFKDVPHFDAVETAYGMKVVSRKPGPNADTEYVDEKSFALPSILQIGDTEFTHFKQPREALSAGSHNAHFMFVTPNDDHSFTLFTVNHYTGSDPEFFQKLSPSRKVEAKTEKKPYDRRKYSPFRGNVRTEDIACQGTQPMLDRRREQLATSDKGVILIRKIILNAIQAVQDQQTPKGVLPADQAHALVTIDSFTGMRAKGSK